MPISFIGCSSPYCEAVLARLAERLLDGNEVDVALVQCDSPDRWNQLAEQAAFEGRIVIAILAELVTGDFVNAFVRGASGAVYLDMPSSVTADVVMAALHGEALLPTQLVTNMALLAKRLQPPTDLTDPEVELLRAVAAGRTIVELARERFFSERTLRRHLQGLYLKLGVRNRAEAIAAATRMGVID